MRAPTKRRHFSIYLSLPLVVAIALLLVAQLAALQRADVIAELVDRVTHQDAPEAAAAVRQLAEIPHPPIAVLVVAATSADREVAREAQQAISKLLRRSQRQIEIKRGVAAVARQLDELAESLANQRDMFLTLDHPWLTDTTRKIVRLANQIPAQHTPLVALHCDEILAAIPAAGSAPAKVAHGSAAKTDPFATAVVAPENSDGAEPANLLRKLRVAAATPETTSSVGQEPQSDSQSIEVPSADVTSEKPLDDRWRATWANPMFRVTPATPVNATRDDEHDHEPRTLAPSSNTLPDDAEVSEHPMAGVETRQLLKEWLQANDAEVALVEDELVRRGFGHLSKQLVQRYLSEQPEDRLRFVDDVLIEPGIDARPWLMLLTDDSDADVRLLAVTIMATSNDAALVEKAWQVAIQDRDPRVAELAGRLKERRAAIQRR